MIVLYLFRRRLLYLSCSQYKLSSSDVMFYISPSDIMLYFSPSDVMFYFSSSDVMFYFSPSDAIFTFRLSDVMTLRHTIVPQKIPGGTNSCDQWTRN